MTHSTMSSNKKRIIRNIGATLLALTVWELAALLLRRNILVASPVDVLKVLPSLWSSGDFYASVWFSMSRIIGGFLLGTSVGCLLAALSSRFAVAEVLLMPYMAAVKSVPVASFVIIALIWLSSSQLSVFITFLIVLPVIYSNILKGLQSTDRKMLEMADAFGVPVIRRLIYIRLPQIKPYLMSASSVAMGLAWKSGVAAEIIGIPDGSIGESLYFAKVYLNTPELFAWTLTIVILSVGFEKLFCLLLKLFFREVERL